MSHSLPIDNPGNYKFFSLHPMFQRNLQTDKHWTSKEVAFFLQPTSALTSDQQSRQVSGYFDFLTLLASKQPISWVTIMPGAETKAQEFSLWQKSDHSDKMSMPTKVRFCFYDTTSMGVFTRRRAFLSGSNFNELFTGKHIFCAYCSTKSA